MSNTVDERREHQRRDTVLSMQGTSEEGAVVARMTARNLSLGGLYCTSSKDYPEMTRVFAEGVEKCRTEHVPVLFHVDEMIQPTGHSTSGSHERYKSRERLDWEAAHDPLVKMEAWILKSGLATKPELENIRGKVSKQAREARDVAWKNYIDGSSTRELRKLSWPLIQQWRERPPLTT